MKTAPFFCIFILLLIGPGYAQKKKNPQVYTYKSIDTVDLNLQVYSPKKMKRNDRLPAVIFFFGGGWVQGTTNQFKSHCMYLADLGIIGITADYRVKNRHNSTPP